MIPKGRNLEGGGGEIKDPVNTISDGPLKCRFVQRPEELREKLTIMQLWPPIMTKYLITDP